MAKTGTKVYTQEELKAIAVEADRELTEMIVAFKAQMQSKYPGTTYQVMRKVTADQVRPEAVTIRHSGVTRPVTAQETAAIADSLAAE